MSRDPRIQKLDISDADKMVVEQLGRLRALIVPHKSPRCLDLLRAIDDVTSEFTGDREFFHVRNHSIGG